MVTSWIISLRGENGARPDPLGADQARLGAFTLFSVNIRAEKDKALNQAFSFSASVLPSRAGDGDTVMPADSIAADLEPASPLPPEMIAPAWPMRRPGGAVTPAMKPTI